LPGVAPEGFQAFVVGRKGRLPSKGYWNPEREEQLRNLFSRGLPYAKIARQMGASRSAVIGKAHRLGLKATSAEAERNRWKTSRKTHGGSQNAEGIATSICNERRFRTAGIGGKGKKAARKADLELLAQTEQLEPLMEEATDPLANFVETADREQPWVFEGRTQERASVVRRCKNALEEFKKGKPQRTVKAGVIVVQGPPGAGKTSLVTALSQTRWKEDGRPLAATVRIDAEDLCDEAKLVREIVRQVAGIEGAAEKGPESFRKVARTAWNSTKLAAATMEAAAATPGLSSLPQYGKTAAEASGLPDRKAGTPAAEKPLTALGDLKRNIPRESWDVPVLLLIDEFQEIRENVRSVPLSRDSSEPAGSRDIWDGEKLGKAKATIRCLHKGGHDLPVIVVCAGLSDTWNTLQDMGLTRTADSLEFNIDCLEPEEAVRVTRRMLDGCRIVGASKEGNGWAELVADRTDGYPQHLHNGLVALGSLLENCGRRLGEVDRNEWEALEAGTRHRMYTKRRSVEMRQASSVVASIMQEMGEEGLEDDEIDAALRRLRKAAFPPGTEADRETAWVKEMGVEWMKEHLLHQGAVQRTPEGAWKCGIPSFRTWLSMAGHPLHQAVLMKDVKRVWKQIERRRDPLETCLDGRTAVEIAREEGNRNILRMLEAAVRERGVRKAEEGNAVVTPEMQAKAEAERRGGKVFPRIPALFQRMLKGRNNPGTTSPQPGGKTDI